MICLVDSPTSVVVSGKCDNWRKVFTSEVSALKWQSYKRSRTLMVTSVTPCAPTKLSASSHIVERPHRYWLWEEDKTCRNNYFHNWRLYSLKDETPWCVDAPARHSSHGSVYWCICTQTFDGNHLNVTLVETFDNRWCLIACVLTPTLVRNFRCGVYGSRLAEYNTVV